MNHSFKKILTATSVAILFAACSKKPEPKAEAVQSNPVNSAELVAKARFALVGNLQDKTDGKKPESEDKEEKKNQQKLEIAKKEEVKLPVEGDKSAPKAVMNPLKTDINPIRNNEVILSTFSAYDKTGIDDQAFDLDNLKLKIENETLSTEDQTKVFEQYFKIIETKPAITGEDPKDTDLVKTLPIQDRMKAVFDFYATNTVFAQMLSDKIKNQPVMAKLSLEEKKIAEPFVYLSTQFASDLKTKDGDYLGFNVSETTDSKTKKKFHTMILGRVDWSAGSKKKSLTEADKKNLNLVRDMTNAWISSSAKPEKTEFQIIGYGEKDKNEPANVAASERRAKLVYEYLTAATPAIQGTYTVVGKGSSVLLKDNPKDVKNRRIDIVLSDKEVVEAPAPNANAELKNLETDSNGEIKVTIIDAK